MRRKTFIPLKELINQNKMMILNDREELKKIEDRLENKKRVTRSSSSK